MLREFKLNLDPESGRVLGHQRMFFVFLLSPCVFLTFTSPDVAVLLV